jgi:outer membrane lipoprotein-sorting protein
VTPSLDKIIPLLYRASWYDLYLSARVFQRALKPQQRLRSNEPRDSENISEYRGLIRLAPGGRYRVDLTDQDGDDYVTGRNGQVSWKIIDGVATRLALIESTHIPFKNLLMPSWLIAGFTIDVIEATEIEDRQAYKIHAVPRKGAHRHVESHRDFTDVNALIDARLGILLRCETLDGRGARNVFELSEIKDGSSVVEEAGIFALPVGAADQGSGVVAAGSSRQPVQSNQLPSAATAEELNLIYRSHLPPAEFSAVLREQSNPSLMVQAARDALGASSATASRIVSSRWMRNFFTKRVPSSSAYIAEVQISMPGRCRIDFRGETRGGVRSIVYDGCQAIRANRGKAGVRTVGSFPAGVGLIVDLAWLLDGYKLSREDLETFSGRAAIRFEAVAENVTGEILTGPLADSAVPADKIEVTIDRELGIALLLSAYFQGQLALECELSEIVPYVQADAFRLDEPL